MQLNPTTISPVLDVPAAVGDMEVVASLDDLAHGNNGDRDFHVVERDRVHVFPNESGQIHLAVDGC